MKTFYNEIEPFCVEWMQNLMTGNVITPGYVEPKSITEITPDELEKYQRCHFFSGIGVWDYALRQAGWPDDIGVWTGSCPCQGFSCAGKRRGFDDERHLWPVWFKLIKARQPLFIFGEQVASKDALAWLDLVCDDLESEGYTVRAFDLCAAGFGGPHIRQRLFWMAVSECHGYNRQRKNAPVKSGNGEENGIYFGGDKGLCKSETNGVDDARTSKLGRISSSKRDEYDGNKSGREREDEVGYVTETGPVNGFWSRDAEWIPCTDNTARPTECGTFPLAYVMPRSIRQIQPRIQGISSIAEFNDESLKRAKRNRIGRIKAYGNAIVAEIAIEFIKSVMDEFNI